nr:MAG TPA: hypothetical protein [Caudoviricetes sp.]
MIFCSTSRMAASVFALYRCWVRLKGKSLTLEIYKERSK